MDTSRFKEITSATGDAGTFFEDLLAILDTDLPYVELNYLLDALNMHVSSQLYSKLRNGSISDDEWKLQFGLFEYMTFNYKARILFPSNKLRKRLQKGKISHKQIKLFLDLASKDVSAVSTGFSFHLPSLMAVWRKVSESELEPFSKNFLLPLNVHDFPLQVFGLTKSKWNAMSIDEQGTCALKEVLKFVQSGALGNAFGLSVWVTHPPLKCKGPKDIPPFDYEMSDARDGGAPELVKASTDATSTKEHPNAADENNAEEKEGKEEGIEEDEEEEEEEGGGETDVAEVELLETSVDSTEADAFEGATKQELELTQANAKDNHDSEGAASQSRAPKEKEKPRPMTEAQRRARDRAKERKRKDEERKEADLRAKQEEEAANLKAQEDRKKARRVKLDRKQQAKEKASQKQAHAQMAKGLEEAASDNPSVLAATVKLQAQQRGKKGRERAELARKKKLEAKQREQNKRIVVLVGPPGAGKGTVGRRMAAEMEVPLLYMNDMLERVQNEDTEIGARVKAIMRAKKETKGDAEKDNAVKDSPWRCTVCSRANPALSTACRVCGAIRGREIMKGGSGGQLVPDEIIIDVVKSRTEAEDCANGYILDGFPQNVEQAKALDAMLHARAEMHTDPSQQAGEWSSNWICTICQRPNVACNERCFLCSAVRGKVLGKSTAPATRAPRPGGSVTVLLALQVPDSVLEDRICSRWIHAPSGRMYNLTNARPKSLPLNALTMTSENMRDDETGEPLTQRSKDKKEVFRDRLKCYYFQTTPVVGHYAGVAIHITAKDREECWRGCAAALGIDLPISQEGGENKYKKSEQDSSQELESEKGEMREIIPEDALNEIEEALREIANKNDASGKDHEEI